MIPPLLDEILKAIGATGDEPVKGPKGETTLREALLRDCRITQTTPKFLKMIAARANAAPLLNELLDPERKEDLDRYLWGMEVIDFLIEHPSIKISPQEFVDVLAKLQPRLYSIASSLKAHPDQVHLTLDVVRYESHGRQRKGVCSTFLAERADNVPVPVFPNASKFRLPEDGNTPIIMVGPGTGIAPFRALFAGAKSGWGEGKKLALLRVAASALQLFLSGRIRRVYARRNPHTTRLRLVARSGPQDLCPAQDAGERTRNLEVARRRGRPLFRVRRRPPHGQGRRRRVAHHRARQGAVARQIRRRKSAKRYSRKAEERQTLQARRLTNRQQSVREPPACLRSSREPYLRCRGRGRRQASAPAARRAVRIPGGNCRSASAQEFSRPVP